MTTHYLSFVIGLPSAAVLLYFFFKGTRWRLQTRRRSRIIIGLQFAAMAGVVIAQWR